MNTVTSDVPLPDGLWAQIEKVAGEGKAVPGAEPKEEHKDEKPKPKAPSSTGEVPSKFMGIKVYLVEDTPGILGGRNYELQFGEGGGELDFKDFVADKTGNFKIAIEPQLPIPAPPKDEHGEAKPEGEAKAEPVPVEIPEPGQLKIFYLSNAIRRSYDNETLGGGCRNYYDITTYFDKSMKADGIAATTTAARHVSALAGTYFFAQNWGSKIYLAHLTIKDSRFRDLQCKPIVKKEKPNH